MPLAFQSTTLQPMQSDFGTMSISCKSCEALHWLEERISSHPSTIRNPLFNTCCNHSDVVIPLMQQLPPLLQSLYNDDTSLASHFRTHIQKYNSALAFTSLKYKPDQRVRGRLQCFQIHGALCKWGSGLLKSRLCFLTSKKHKQDYKQRGTTTWG